MGVTRLGRQGSSQESIQSLYPFNPDRRTLLRTEGDIDADHHLTPEGKVAARAQAGKAAMEAIAKWHTPKLAGLDADLGVHRAALLPTGEKPDERRVAFMLSVLQKHTPEEVSVFYGSATDSERLVLEAAAASVGRMPTKTANGLVWQPLLDPKTVNDSIIARATAKNPEVRRS